MASILEKIKGSLFYDSAAEDYDDYEYGEEGYEADEPLRASSRLNRRRVEDDISNIVPMPSTSSNKLVIYNPQRIEDMKNVVDSLKSRKSVVIMFDGLDIALIQRMIDFAAGTVCALNCTSTMVSKNVCVIVPRSTELIKIGTGKGNR